MFQFTSQNTQSADLLASLLDEESFILLSSNQDTVHAELLNMGLQKSPYLNQFSINLKKSEKVFKDQASG